MELRFQTLIDISSVPFASSARQVRKALECLHAGEVLKMRARSERDSAGIQDLAQEANCEVVCGGMCGYVYECLIRKQSEDDRQDNSLSCRSAEG